jgi:hypothetical protein
MSRRKMVDEPLQFGLTAKQFEEEWIAMGSFLLTAKLTPSNDTATLLVVLRQIWKAQ